MRTIYVLDDAETVRRSVQAVLAPLGEVVTATLWSQLSQDLLSRPAEGSLLVCDLDMPGINGVDLCEILRRYKPELPIVMFTGQPGAVPSGLADRVVSKRDGLGALKSAVEAHLGRGPAPDPGSDEFSRARLATQRALELARQASVRLA